MGKTAERNKLDFDGLRPATPVLLQEHDAWRDRVRSFVDTEIAPHIDVWDEAGTFPEALYLRAGEAGLLGMGFPVEVGGEPDTADLAYRIIFAEEMHRLGTGVVFADLATHWIGLPPVVEYGSPRMLDDVAKPVLRGEKKIAFAVTEPGGGSDVSGLVTEARSDGDCWRINGTKTLISGAMRADYILTAVRTGGAGIRGISLLLIPAAAEGVARQPVPGLRWYNASVGTLRFDDVKVPKTSIVGEENAGFAALAGQFNIERFSGVAATLAMCRVCVADALAFARERRVFGQTLVEHQVIRHKLVDAIRQIHAAYGYLDACVWKYREGRVSVADLSMLKVQATTTLEACAREALHILGGRAYQHGSRNERIFRESRIFAVGGGTEEVLRDLTARQLGF